jgi:hypothetical protein
VTRDLPRGATSIGRIAEHAVISATVTVFGQTQVLRMNKTEYRQMLTQLVANQVL